MNQHHCSHKIALEQEILQENISNLERVQKLLGVKNLRFGNMSETEFVKISYVMNSILPQISNPNVTEIDDLHYPNIDISQVVPSTIGQYYVIEKNDWIFQNISKWFYEFFVYISIRNDCEYCNYVIDTVGLQIIEHYSLENFTNVRPTLIDLFESNGYADIIYTLKILRSLFDKYDSSFLKVCFEFQFYLIKLLELNFFVKDKQYPPRISNWISNQLSFFKDKISSYEWEGRYKILNIIKNGFDESSAQILLNITTRGYDIYDTVSWELLCLDLWFCYLKSARDEVEKLNRIKFFVRELYEYLKKKHHNFVEEVMAFGKKNLGFLNQYNIKLLSEIDFFEHNTKNQIEKKMRKLFVCDDVENMLYDFMEHDLPHFKIFNKSVNLLYMINTAFKMCQEQGWMENDEITEMQEFINKNRCINRCIIKTIEDSSGRGVSRIFLNILMKKCPNLFFESEREYLMEDLRKMLKGEADEHTVERLYAAVKDTPTYEKQRRDAADDDIDEDDEDDDLDD